MVRQETFKPRMDIAEFRKWLNTVPPERLKTLLMDAFWHDRLTDTELLRFYELERAGISMDSALHRPQKRKRRKVARTSG